MAKVRANELNANRFAISQRVQPKLALSSIDNAKVMLLFPPLTLSGFFWFLLSVSG